MNTTYIQNYIDPAFGLLLHAASERRTVTYREFVEQLNSLNEEEFGLFGARGQRTWAFLRHLSTEEFLDGRGMITALVVSVNSGIPGNGFFALVAELGGDGDDEKEIWEAEVEKIYNAWSHIPQAPLLPAVA